MAEKLKLDFLRMSKNAFFPSFAYTVVLGIAVLFLF